MSYKDFQDAVALADSTDGSHKDFGPVPSEDRIKASEALLGCRFPPMYREFVSRFGCGGIGSNEVWGPVGDDLSLASPPNVVGMNLDERSSYGLPDDVLLICAIGNGEHYALDLSHVDESGEPQVIVWPVGGLDDRSDAEVVATDFGEFLLSQFQQALENINARDIPER